MKIEGKDINVVPEVLVAEGELPDGIEEQEEILAEEESNSSNNKRIAKNTMLLYLRMLLTMGVSLYTSRVVLEVLGVEDFGIYNVVGGVVIMFSFLNSAMSSATQRYLSFELGRGNFEELKKIFNITVNIHFLIAFIIVLLAETVGLWFFNNKLNIPEVRMVAANWVYQFSIATFFMTVISVPYNAAIISHERMNIYAYVSIFEVLAKLGIVYLIKVLGGDKLAIYAGLLFIVAAIIRFIYGFYCNRNFKECRYSWIWDQDKYKEMLSYAGWNLWGNLALVFMEQGTNIILNIFFGPVLNTAKSISNQVNAAINGFVFNFLSALNPQITKSYASGDIMNMQMLLYIGSRVSLYLLFVLSVPFIFFTNNILDLWLREYPDSTSIFVRLMLVNALVNSISYPLVTAVLAKGRIKIYQTVIGGLQLLNLPISYCMLNCGFTSEVVFYNMIIISFLAFILRLCFLYKYKLISLKEFLKEVVVRAFIVVFMTTLALKILFLNWIAIGYFELFFQIVLAVIIAVLFVLAFGLKKDEKRFIICKCKMILYNKFTKI